MFYIFYTKSEKAIDMIRNSLPISRTTQQEGQQFFDPPSYTFAQMGKDFLNGLKEPLGLIAMIPIVAGAGALTAYSFTSIAPLAGAIILGNCASIAVYTSFACRLLGLNDRQTVLASLITGIFLSIIASISALNYLRMPPVPVVKMILLTIGTGLELSILYAFLKNLKDG